MSGQPVRVLVADSNGNHRKAVARQLQNAGYFVVPAADGADVLLHCELDPPDVFLIDVRLSDVDGYDLCAQIRSEPHLAEVPIILTTEVRDRMSRAYLKQMVEYAGGDYFLARPWDVNVLVKLLKAIVPPVPPVDSAVPAGFPTRVVWPTSVPRTAAASIL